MFDYTVTTEHSTEKTITRLKEELQKVSFGVLWEFDLAGKLDEKGLDFEGEYHILEVCNPKEAHRVLSAERRAGYFLPCKLAVFTENGQTKIGMPRPTALIALVEDEQLKQVAKEVEDQLLHVIDASK
ncbi:MULTISPECIES: DUF302 domain-containing protein [unclassified Exiguobacterium]|uniref:DUF302 domain-containing protein n=1 Tax=unclassified Exiguobacterium TaxID=2644629 RepID=UPI000B58D659|nr:MULTISPECIES: DUF302 domain-containing protein [unclassified Exiguobacterium]ASI34352.1 hypothetical protein A0126_01760 [Exiguobacterium sp. N4-1P]